MKKSHKGAALLAAILLAGSLAACGSGSGQAPAPSSASSRLDEQTGIVPASKTPQSTTPDPAASQAASVPAFSGSQVPAGSTDGKTQSEKIGADKPQAGGTGTPTTSLPEGFQERWTNNPIDASYHKENETAESTTDIIRLAEKYESIWSAEVDSAYKRLITVSGSDANVKMEQKAWSDGRTAALQKIAADNAGNGSGAKIATAVGVMDYYRQRAQALYLELYQYDHQFKFQFEEGLG